MLSGFFKNNTNTSSPSVIIAEYPHPDEVKNSAESSYINVNDAEEDVRAFLNRLTCAPENASILNILIQYGAIPDGICLTNLVAFEFPLDAIRQINDERLMSHGYDYGNNVIADYLLYAAFHRDPNVLNFFIDRHEKEEVNLTLKNLNIMKEWATADLKLIVGDKQRIFSSQSCQAAMNRLLKSAKHLPLNQRAVCDSLLGAVADAKTPEEWRKIYMDHVDEPYLNGNTKYSFGIFKKSYGNIKKIFIKNIQRNISEYFMDIEVLATFIKKNNITAYHALCREVLQSDVFSKTHEKYGVTPIFGRNLNRRVEEIEDTFKDIIFSKASPK